jgi:hypothetical protein
MHRQRLLFLVFGVPAFINGVPEAKALQKSSARLQPRHPVTGPVQQSSRQLPLPSSARNYWFIKSLVPPSSSRTGAAVVTTFTTTPTRGERRRRQMEHQPREHLQDLRRGANIIGSNQDSPLQDSSLAAVPLDRLAVVWASGIVLLGAAASGLLAGSGRLSALVRDVAVCLQGAFGAYQGALVARPLATKVATGATLAILGDALAQSTAATSSSSSVGGGATTAPPYDKRRAASFAAFDSCYRVFQHFVFPAVIGFCRGNVAIKFLPRALGPAAAAVERTLLYQLVVVPVSRDRRAAPHRSMSWSSP